MLKNELIGLLHDELIYQNYLDELGAIQTLKDIGFDVPWFHNRLFNIKKTQLEMHKQEEIEEKLESIEEKLYSVKQKNLLDEKYVHLKKIMQLRKNLCVNKNLAFLHEENKLVETYDNFISSVRKELSCLEILEPKQKWIAECEVVFRHGDRANDILNNLINTRNKICINTPYHNYHDYCSALYQKELKSEEEYSNLKKGVLNYFTPLINQHRKQTKENKIYPWNFNLSSNLSPNGKYIPLKYFMNDVLSKLYELDIDFYHYIKDSYLRGYINLDEQNTRHDNGFCMELPFTKKSFISIRPENTYNDYFYLIHELGHCYHNFLKRDVQIYSYRETSTEINEFAAHFFESILVPLLFKDSSEILKKFLSETISSIPWNIVIHEFQIKLYTKSDSYFTFSEKSALFLKLIKKYTHTNVELDGYEKLISSLWILEEEVFTTPFYYIEYAYAKLSALKLLMDKSPSEEKIARYRQCFSLGQSNTLTMLLQVYSLPYVMTEEDIRDIGEKLKDFL
ncbi:M3 family metallopeptidase [Sutcliffiella cohnii]